MTGSLNDRPGFDYLFVLMFNGHCMTDHQGFEMPRTIFRFTVAGLVRLMTIVTAGALSITAHAIDDIPKVVNVQPGNVAEALETLAKEFGVYVIYPSSQLKGLKTAGVSGKLQSREAFRRLIEGTPLVMKEEGGAI